MVFGKKTYCQSKNEFKDSVLLKKEIDAILAKHGLKSKGFLINVISLNQRGGQTAYSITNNYYGEPNYVPDSINYIYKIDLIGGKKVLVFSPKHGTWTSPFIIFDSVKPKTTSLEGFISSINFTLDFNSTKYKMIGTKSSNPCTIRDPIYVYLGEDNDPIVGFGDYGYDTRYYLYFHGTVVCVPVHFQ